MTDEIVPTAVTVLVAQEAAPVPEPSVPPGPPAPASAGAATAPLSTPYRAPVVEPVPVEAPSPKRWPVLGLSLWVFGVAMWSYLVMGELTTSYGPGKHDFLVNEGTAAFFVLLSSVGAWAFGLRASLASVPAQTTSRAVLRAVGAALLALVIWIVVTVAAVALFGTVRADIDGKVTVGLGLIAGAGAYLGQRLAGLRRSEPTQRDRLVARAAWIGAAIMTLIALAEVIGD